jgi:hypothetical protein
MNELLGKISSYNIFNYLFSGVVFVALANAFTRFSFIQENLLIAVGLYYFIGLVLSRIGSLIIEPMLKLLSFIKFAPYQDFVRASKVDPQIEVLSEVNNMYRTLVMVFLGLILLKLYEVFQIKLGHLGVGLIFGIFGFLLIVFLLAYRKQTSYIAKRIKTNTKDNE